MGSNFTFTTLLGDLDLLGYLEPLGDYDALIKHAETYRIGDLVAKTIGLDDLIRIKEHIKRPKDRESLAQLRAIKQVRAEMEREGPSLEHLPHMRCEQHDHDVEHQGDE